MPLFKVPSRFMKECSLLTVTVEAPHLGPSGSTFKDGRQDLSSFRLFDCNNSVLLFESRLKEFLMDSPSKVTSISLPPWLPLLQSFPIITRGLAVSPYWTTTDDRIMEVAITKVTPISTLAIS